MVASRITSTLSVLLLALSWQLPISSAGAEDAAPATTAADCEMNTQAVLVANEEKATAERQRDEAKEAYVTLQEKLTKITQEQETSQQARETLEERLAFVERTAERATETHAQELQAARGQIQAQVDETSSKLRKEAADRIDAANRDATRIVEESTEKNRLQIVAMREELKIQEAATESLMQYEKEESDKKIKGIVKEAETEVLKTRDLAKHTIEEANRRANNDVTAVTNEMASLKLTFEIELSELKQATESAAAKAKEEEEMKRKDVIEEAKAEIAKVKKDASNQVSSAQEDASRQVSQVETRLKKAEQQVAEYQHKADKKFKEASDHVQTNNMQRDMEASSWQEKLIAADTRIEGLQKKSDDLSKTLASTKESLEYWENQEQGYCNFTLIHEHSSSLLLKAQSKATDRWIMAYAAAIEQTYKFGESHGPTLKKKYDQHVQTAVDTHLIPIYKEKVLPVYEENVLPIYNEKVLPIYNEKVLPIYNEKVSPVLESLPGAAIEYKGKAVEAAEDVRANIIVPMVSNVCQSASTTLKGMDTTAIPSMVHDKLDYCQEESKEVVRMLGLAGGLLFLFLMRRVIFRVVLGLLCLPFRVVVGLLLLPWRVVWFFCPLRLILRSRRPQQQQSDETAKSSSKSSSSSSSNPKSNGKSHGNKKKKTGKHSRK